MDTPLRAVTFPTTTAAALLLPVLAAAQWQPVAGAHPAGAIAGDCATAMAVASTTTNGTEVHRCDGVQWTLLANSPLAEVSSMTVTAAGDLLAVGPGGPGWVLARCPRATGATPAWTVLGSGIGAALRLWEDDGTVVVAGVVGPAGGGALTGLARWNGSTWTFPPMPTGSGTAPVVAAVARTGLGFVVGGDFTVGGASNLALWNGLDGWAPIAGNRSTDAVTHLLATRDGGVLVVGRGPTGLVQRLELWQPNAGWSVLAAAIDGEVHDVLELPDGDVVLAGPFTAVDGVPTRGLARYDGAQWHALATTITPPTATVHEARWLREGCLLVAGSFLGIGGVAANGLAMLGTPQPAGELAVPACAPGSPTVATRQLAWVGGRYRGLVTGWPIALGQPTVQVLGFGTSGITLPGPGCAPCVLWPWPDFVGAPVDQDGVDGFPVAFDVPDLDLLVGLDVQYQVVGLGGAGFPCFRATNALVLTIGRY
ncbi:MAG: hypothetical protein KF830_17365 [Planctomycetes bacterium]|nr:hypothetical protein [Planctomycetota bacterium]